MMSHDENHAAGVSGCQVNGVQENGEAACPASPSCAPEDDWHQVSRQREREMCFMQNAFSCSKLKPSKLQFLWNGLKRLLYVGGCVNRAYRHAGSAKKGIVA